MPPIRTLLWIGPSDELAQLGVLDAPSLDIVWVSRPEELGPLPPLALDAVVIGRLDAPANDALACLAQLAHERIRAPVIVMRFGGGDADRQRFESAGADRVLGVNPEPGAPGDPLPCLLAAIESVLARPALKTVCKRGTYQARPAGAGPRLVGSSQAMRCVDDGIRCAGGSMASALVLGETGSGKEIVARRIHAASARAARPFVAVNCGAFADTLLESELFGHKRGSFTGADRDRVGLFERADGGTLFLDEIGETSPALQARLLRAVQEREIVPVGGDRTRRVDVRIIAATHRDLGGEIEHGRFREDLYYRLAVLQVCIPPLRERPDDVAPLVDYFLAKFGEREAKTGCQFSPRALRLLERHRWPGNVRELENEIQRALAVCEPGELITARRLSADVRGDVPATRPGDRARGTERPMRIEDAENLQQALDRVESTLIRETLADHDGRRAKTARRLGVTREGLYKKMKRLGIE